MKLDELKGIGPKTIKKLQEASINTVEDLLLCFPKRYDVHHLNQLDHVLLNEEIQVEVKVISKPSIFFIRKNLTKMIVNVEKAHFRFRIVIFNRHFLSPVLFKGQSIVVYGRFKQNLSTFIAHDMVLSKNYQEGIIPVYQIKDIPERKLSKAIQDVLHSQYPIQEFIPSYILEDRQVLEINEAIRYIHQPKSSMELERAKYRLKYQELLKFAMRIELIKSQKMTSLRLKKNYDIDKVRELIRHIGFELTNAQKKATNEIFSDLKSPYQMNRLLQGDVGSGKTIVALLAAYATVTASEQVALMAPTLVLAHQHFQVFNQYLALLGVRIVLITSELSVSQRNQIAHQVKKHHYDIIIGTHSLIQDSQAFNKLGMIIIDEQHRFGVEQRKRLREKGVYPDVLMMSATPIPRSLAISIYESSDISQITEKPAGRKEINTKIVSFDNIALVYERISKEICLNHQVFIVCPLIEENDDHRYFSVYEAEKLFRNQFPSISIDVLHGKMKEEEKIQILDRFENNHTKILISTTVIEVGVHIDSATLMIVLDANRFGLAQLHQLRGRIGRNDFESYCYLVLDEIDDEKERLEILEKSNDGFEISYVDLKQRGPGEVFGKNQTGIPQFNFANIVDDELILKKALEDSTIMIKANDLLAKQYKTMVLDEIESYHLD